VTTKLLAEKYAADLHGVLHCYDRIIITGNLQPLCYPQGMTKYLYDQSIRIFAYTDFASPLRDQIRANAQAIAKENNVEIEFISKGKGFRKEDRIQEVLKTRGDHPGLVHIFAAMERCPAYIPWHDKQSGKTYVKSTSGKCLHYYFYFIDEELGLCYLRVPTWCPFRLQFYCNDHNWLASQLKQRGIAFEQHDNAFLVIADLQTASQLAAQLDVQKLHAKLASFAQRYCPVATTLGLEYSWSLMQAEYATDLIYKRQQTLPAFFPFLVETLIQAVKPADVATFLGRKLHSNRSEEHTSELQSLS